MSETGLDLIVQRNTLAKARIAAAPVPMDLPDGSCLLKIASFALTANNITYGVAADQLGYWNFFPTESDSEGLIPVWGFAEVVASAHPEVEVGTRVYGYLPMSTHVLVHPGKVTPAGFIDTALHRAKMAPIYNHYVLTAADPQWAPEHEAMISLFRPLLTTSFLLDDFHRENGFFGAATVILSSASSKTAMGLAHLLSQDKPADLTIAGLTSAANLEFVRALGCYDTVFDYAALESLPNGPAAFVDMAGNADVRRRIHTRFGENLKSSRAVGLTHWQAAGGLEGADLPGIRPEFFFAPAYAQERIGALGQAEFMARLDKAWRGFLPRAQGWITVVTYTGPEAVLERYHASQRGDIAPGEGYILSLNPE